MRLNVHGIVGLLGIVLMVAFTFLLHWDVPGDYVLLAIILYGLAIIPLTALLNDSAARAKWVAGWSRDDVLRLIYACHFSFWFLAFGLLIGDTNWKHVYTSGKTTYTSVDFGAYRLYFVGSIALGFTVAFLLIRTTDKIP